MSVNYRTCIAKNIELYQRYSAEVISPARGQLPSVGNSQREKITSRPYRMLQARPMYCYESEAAGGQANIFTGHAGQLIAKVYLSRGRFMVVTSAGGRLAGTIHIVNTSYSLTPTRIPRPLNIAENTGQINVATPHNIIRQFQQKIS